ncbi:MAG: hypothetical protein GY854_18635, partial [Deltaproteobacteria bacterium]|nr:hypothetical protein [Deltaproteobacteria bacterium]
EIGETFFHISSAIDFAIENPEEAGVEIANLRLKSLRREIAAAKGDPEALEELVAESSPILISILTGAGVRQVAKRLGIEPINAIRNAAQRMRRSTPSDGSRKPTISKPGDGTPESAGEIVPKGTGLADDLLELPTSQSWGRLGTLEDHFVRHGRDFAATSADDYARQASQFLQWAQRKSLPTKVDPRTGVIRVYDPATNTFGSYNPSGTTRTFYKPNPAVHGYPTNLDYWNAQPGGPPWTP